MRHRHALVYLLCVVGLQTAIAVRAEAQDDAPRQTSVHSESPSRWTSAIDGQLFATFNDQGGARGETEVRSQNWLMGMASRPVPAGTLTLPG